MPSPPAHRMRSVFSISRPQSSRPHPDLLTQRPNRVLVSCDRTSSLFGCSWGVGITTFGQCCLTELTGWTLAAESVKSGYCVGRTEFFNFHLILIDSYLHGPVWPMAAMLYRAAGTLTPASCLTDLPRYPLLAGQPTSCRQINLLGA